MKPRVKPVHRTQETGDRSPSSRFASRSTAMTALLSPVFCVLSPATYGGVSSGRSSASPSTGSASTGGGGMIVTVTTTLAG